MQTEVESISCEVTLSPDNYGLALDQALRVIQAAHPIIVEAIEKGGIDFDEIQRYIECFSRLQSTCGCEDIRFDAFLDEAVDGWDYQSAL